MKWLLHNARSKVCWAGGSQRSSALGLATAPGSQGLPWHAAGHLGLRKQGLFQDAWHHRHPVAVSGRREKCTASLAALQCCCPTPLGVSGIEKGTDFAPKPSSFLSKASRPPLFLGFGYDFRNPCNPCSCVPCQLLVCPKHPRLQGSRRCRKGLALVEALPCRSSNIPLSSTL